ncbi:uncharacterized protein LOC112057728 [Bicyclus anynana]|uniref:Uncharacterized protein LOC112057728 n=1 Tax=Bicyclus anynana TaxID=110368 RepID=A0ABM3LR41_BICAN|nr:uncharacterized protein LOC112057728 [Bicyclus anynana]
MEIPIKNINFSVRLSLTALRLTGFWAPQGLVGTGKLLYILYGFVSFMFLLGTYLIIQIVDLYLIWGNLPAMTATSFLLFTNLSQSIKIFNVLARREKIQQIITDADIILRGEKSSEGQAIVRSCNRETRWHQFIFFIFTFFTIFGWASSAEKNKLPLQAWYPYDTSKSPAYELTYLHQILALFLAAFLNVSKDTLVSTLIAQCRCRLRLLGLALKNLCNEMHPIDEETSTRVSLKPSPYTLMLSQEQEVLVKRRLGCCVVQHQKALEAANQLQHCFSEPTFVQLAVSLVIICVTAFQMTAQTSNPIRLLSMCTYLLNMMFQVFIYCYQGNQLSLESEEVAGAAYEFPWYACSVPVRRSVIILMRRCRRVSKLTVGGFTTLSLASFMAILKTSYSMFTLLQQVDSRKTTVSSTWFITTGYSAILRIDVTLKVYILSKFKIGTTNMKISDNINLSLKITQTIFLMFGLWRPQYLTGYQKQLYNCYSLLSLMSIVGTYIIVQVGDLIQVWGNVPYMTGTIFLLFTNLALATKMINVMWRKKLIQRMMAESNQELSNESRRAGRSIIESYDAETTKQLCLYFSLSMMTVFGWASSAEKNQLPLRAWYPYDTSKTPAYQLTYTHQCVAIFLAAVINICLDTVVTSLISLCRCRLRLLSVSLTTLCDGLDIADHGLLTAASEAVASRRLRRCARRHQDVLAQVMQLQKCFSTPILAQFSVSMVIICVTAYQLAFESTSLVRVISMVAYLVVMMLQVFLYCYHGNQLVEESEDVSTAAYECPWYWCSVSLRRSLLIVMTRTRHAARLTAGGFTQLSLASFMSIIKASYSFFTVLKQVET